MNHNVKVAAAVAAILSAGVSSAQTNGPSPTAAQNGIPLYISGSSAAKTAILQTLETGVSGGSPVFCAGVNYSVFSSTPDPNFFAVSCIPSSAAGLSDTGSVYTVWYRAEGGSVTGALPIISGANIKQMTLNANVATTSTGYQVTIGGASTGNGLNDTFTNTFPAPVQLGITDVEPGALVKNNYPSAYSTSAYGKATASQLIGLATGNSVILDQVFAVFVNTNESALASVNAGQGKAAGNPSTTTPSNLSLSAQTIATILQGKVTDWGKVPLAGSATGAAVAATGTPITVVNREQGSGSRTATDIFFTGDHCSTDSANLPIASSGSSIWPTEYFSTSDVLTNANTIPGSITYATIDQAGASFPNLTLVAIDNVQPSNLAAATGQYGDWFEAWAITNPATTGDAATLAGNLVSALQNISQLGFGQIDLLANPLQSSVAPALPVTNTAGGTTAKPIYTNPYQRGGNSCQDPESSL